MGYLTLLPFVNVWSMNCIVHGQHGVLKAADNKQVRNRRLQYDCSLEFQEALCFLLTYAVQRTTF